MADPKQLEILKQGVDAWNRYRRPGDKIDLSWANLGLAGLRGADLRGGEAAGGGAGGGELPDGDQ